MTGAMPQKRKRVQPAWLTSSSATSSAATSFTTVPARNATWSSESAQKGNKSDDKFTEKQGKRSVPSNKSTISPASSSKHNAELGGKKDGNQAPKRIKTTSPYSSTSTRSSSSSKAAKKDGIPATKPFSKLHPLNFQPLAAESIDKQAFEAYTLIKNLEAPIHISKLTSSLEIPATPALIAKLKTFPQLSWTDDYIFTFRTLYGIRSALDLLAHLQKQPTAACLRFSDLKNGWEKAGEVVDFLEADGEVLVIRSGKKKDNGAPVSVWLNDKVFDSNVDEEFMELWKGVKIPDDDAELARELKDAGLKTCMEDRTVVQKAPRKKPQRGRPRGRGVRNLNNAHVRGLLMDSDALSRAAEEMEKLKD